MNWEPLLARRISNGRYSNLRQDRVGVMLHYDGSGTDEGSMAWFANPKCGVSYNYLVLDDGDYVEIAPESKRAWHAGVCRPSDPERLPYEDANSAFYGIAAATSGKVDVTPLQVLTVAFLTSMLFRKHDWPVSDTHRIVTHRSEAWKRGRKKDPEGSDLSNPIFMKADIVQLLPLIGVRDATQR